MKKKIILLILTIMLFIGIGGVKGATWSNPEKEDCTNEPYFYNYGESTSNLASGVLGYLVDKCINFGSEAATCLDTCSSTYCVRVGNPCKYFITNETTSKKTQVFCLNGLVELDTGTSYKYAENGTTDLNTGMSCALVDLYKSGKIKNSDFVNNKFTLENISDDETLFYLQKRIWAHQYDDISCKSNTDSDYVSIDETPVSSGVSISFSTNKLTYNFTSKKYVSDPIKISATNIESGTAISLSLSNAPTGSFIATSKDATASTSAVTSVQSGTTVYIIIPSNFSSTLSNVKVTASASVLNKKIAKLQAKFQKLEYTGSVSGDPISQDLGIPSLTRTFEEEYKSKSQPFTLTPGSGKIIITKVNAQNENIKLSGVEFKIERCTNTATPCAVETAKNINGQEIQNRTTGSDGEVTFDNLPYGLYKVTEVDAPNGYSMGTNFYIQREVTAGEGEIVRATISNTPNKIKISKKEISGEDELPGARICITEYANGSKVSGAVPICYVSDTTVHEEYLNPTKTYILEEEVAPYGYDKITTGFIFTVGANFSIALDDAFSNSEYIDVSGDKITLYNEPTKGSIKIIKTSSKDKNIKLSGVKFSIKYYNPTTKKYESFKDLTGKDVKAKTTDENGEVIFENLRFGKYRITEETTPSGYTAPKKSYIDITVGSKDGHKVDTVETIGNNPRNIKISKRDISGEKEVPGAKICVYEYDSETDKKAEEETECFTSTDKPYEFYLAPGTYILEEEVTPEGYEKIETGFIFTIDNNMNIKLKDIKSQNIKVDDDTIIIYNTAVPVEPTGKSAKLIYLVVGLMLVISGGVLGYFKYFKRLRH